jgi:hypothetical protein
MNIFRRSLALGSLFSGCLFISPGSVILTIDASSISADDRAKLVEVGVFICDEGKGADCSQANSYDNFDTILSDKGLKEKETLGLSLRDAVGPLHVRLIAGEANPSFASANQGLVAQAETFVEVESRGNLLVPLRLLPDPLAILELPTIPGRNLFDLSTIGCSGDQPFLAAWSEFLPDNVNGGGIAFIQTTAFDLENKVDPVNTALTEQNVIVFDVEQAGSTSCDNVGVGILKFDLLVANVFPFIAQAAKRANALVLQTYQNNANFIANMNMGFGEDGFSVSWDSATADANKNLSFLQKANENLAPLAQAQQLRGDLGGEGLVKSTTTGGASGVSVFTDPTNKKLVLFDLDANRQRVIANADVGRFPFEPQVVFLDAARILTVWFDCEDVDCRVLGRITDRAGQDASNNFPTPAKLDQACVGDALQNELPEAGCFEIAAQQTNPFDLAVNVGTDGGFVVAWRFQANSGIADGFELQVAFYGTDGPRLNPFSRAADVAAASALDDPNVSQENIQIATTPNGDLAISWIDAVGSGVGGTRVGFSAKVVVVPGSLLSLASTPN